MSNEQESRSPRILTVTEEELSQIILNIHDGPVQYLFTALSLLTRIQNQAEDNPATAELLPQLARVAMLLESSLYEIKFFLGTFDPPKFQNRSLRSLVEGLIIQHEEQTGSTVEFIVEHAPEAVALPVKIAVYRIVQEALSNAYHHAGVDRQVVRLGGDDDTVSVEVIDEGKGFDPPPLEGPTATEQKEHIGLRGMRDRVQLLEGEFQIFSRPGEGTRVVVKVPTHD